MNALRRTSCRPSAIEDWNAVQAPREQGLGSALRLWLWPRVSWRRSVLYYLKRILRLSGTPYAIAMGAAVGVFASFTPFVGFHLIITFVDRLARRRQHDRRRARHSSANPLTFPFIWASTYQLGYLILRGVSRLPPARLEHEIMHRRSRRSWPLHRADDRGLDPGRRSIFGGIIYLVAYKAVSAYQRRAPPAA